MKNSTIDWSDWGFNYQRPIEIYETYVTSEMLWEDGHELNLTILNKLEFNHWTAPWICAWLLRNKIEMTHKHRGLAIRAAKGDTKWMYDSFDYPRVQLMEFHERYVRRYFSDTNTANWQEALACIILREIKFYYPCSYPSWENQWNKNSRETVDLVHRRALELTQTHSI